MKVHELKLNSKFCRMKNLGLKNWELRLNDRDFKVGDYVKYVEVDDSGRLKKAVDGWSDLFHIDSILTHADFSKIPKNWVIWSESEAKENPYLMKFAIMEMAK